MVTLAINNYGDRVNVVGITHAPGEDADRWIRGHRLADIPHIRDHDGAASERFDAVSHPTTILLHPDGTSRRWPGVSAPDELFAEVDRALT